MDSWRKKKGEFHHLDVQGTRSHTRKPPAGNWQQTVPSWEKKFCFLVGSVPWKKLLETKKYMYLYDNVVQWNDSAGEEAFQNAKNRFWAEINGLPCDISSPDPDVYIDKIDWDSEIDEELLLDLERESAPAEGNKDENVVIIGNPLLLNPSFSCVGWGEAEEDFKKETDLSSGPGVEDGDRLNNDNNPWESIYPQNKESMKDQGAENCYNNSWGWDEWDSNLNDWDNSYNVSETVNNRTDHVWGTWDRNKWNREGSGGNMSRYKTTRNHGDDCQISRGGRGGRGGKRLNSSREQPFVDKNSSRQWNSNYCRPVNHDISGKAENSWGWENLPRKTLPRVWSPASPI